ncbi:MAG: OadG family protein [Synergistaceae bacterium]|nr:OadG family protein [Synergistaceae bacterium]
MSTAEYFTGVQGGVLMSLIAFSIVFILISFIMLLMMSLHKACYRAAQKKAAAENVGTRGTLPAAEPEKDDDTELAAVVSAAVMQFVSQDAKIISFRPSAAAAPKKTMWGRLNRLRNLENGTTAR